MERSFRRWVPFRHISIYFDLARTNSIDQKLNIFAPYFSNHGQSIHGRAAPISVPLVYSSSPFESRAFRAFSFGPDDGITFADSLFLTAPFTVVVVDRCNARCDSVFITH